MKHRCTQKKDEKATKTGSGKSEDTWGWIPQNKTENQNHDVKVWHELSDVAHQQFVIIALTRQQHTVITCVNEAQMLLI